MMCNVKELNKSELRIGIKLTNGGMVFSEWFMDDERYVIEDKVNSTEKEVEVYNELRFNKGISDEDVEQWFISRKREDDTVYVSEHAFERMKERCGLNRKSAMRMVQKVYDNGENMNGAKGYLAQWLREKKEGNPEYDKFLMYGDYVYLFAHTTLVTVLHKPHKNSKKYKLG